MKRLENVDASIATRIREERGGKARKSSGFLNKSYKRYTLLTTSRCLGIAYSL